MKEVSKVCLGSFNGVSGNFKEVSKMFKERVFQDSFKGVSKRIEGYFEGHFSGFKGYFNCSGFQGYFKELQWEFQVFRECFKEVSRVFQKRL